MMLAAVWGMNRRSLDTAVPWLLFMVMWGFFSHNVLEERHILLAAALVAQIVWSSRTVPVEAPVPIENDLRHPVLLAGAPA